MSAIEPGQPGVDFVQIVRRFAKVVQADDPLGLAVAGNLVGDVLFQVDVLDPLGDRRAQQHQPSLRAAVVLAAVLLAANGDDHRAGPVGQHALQIDLAVDVIEPQLDELGTLLDQVLVLGDHVAMAAAADADANHGWSAKVGGISAP